MPPICGTVAWDSSMMHRKSRGKKSSSVNGRDLLEELSKCNRNFGDLLQELRTIKQIPRLAHPFRFRSQLLIAAFAALALAGGFLALKQWAEQSVARTLASLRQQYHQDSAALLEDLRRGGGSFRYYRADDQQGRRTNVVVITNGPKFIRDAGRNKEGGAFVMLNP
ncbi:MAG: hypothetical protein M3463_16050 [Verrucomicrobiota bacterium]|nr:hypothetical protein [Verrucomicrobiota bacterium]